MRLNALLEVAKSFKIFNSVKIASDKISTSKNNIIYTIYIYYYYLVLCPKAGL